LRGAAAFFAEPFRAGAEAEAVRFAALAAGLAFADARCFSELGFSGARFSAGRFSTLGAATLTAAALRAAGRVFEEASTGAVTFSGALDGAVFVGLKTSLLVLTATLCVVTTDAAGAAEAALVLPFGRPPFLAN